MMLPDEDGKVDMVLRLRELKAQRLPRVDWHEVFTIDKSFSAKHGEVLNAYFMRFVKYPGAGMVCPGCERQIPESPVLRAIAESIGKTRLEWGLKNGEAFCVVCTYPFRVLHRDVGPVEFLQMPLAYHPDELDAEPREGPEPVEVWKEEQQGGAL